jgi:tetratricopeptide (TPR) repeat protein
MTDLRTHTGWNRQQALGLVILVFASYASVLATAGWIWDDPEYVTRNPVLNGVIENGLWAIWSDTTATPQYYPLVHSSFWLEWRIFPSVLVAENGVTTRQPDPTGFHLTNVILMAATTLVFWRVLLSLRIPGAILAAALFAVHPINVESVAWVTERKNMLSALFALASVLYYLRFAGIGAHKDQEGSRKTYLFAMLLFVCGLLSKTVIAFVPPALLLLIWWQRPAQLKRHLFPLLPLLGLGVVAGLNTARIEIEQVAAGTQYFDLSLIDRFLLAGQVVWTYFLHLIAPFEQIFFYPKWQPDPSSIWQWTLLVSAVLLIIATARSARVFGRGPLVAILIFGGALVPVMGFLDVYPFRFSWIADHFQYHANFSLFALLGAALTKIRLPAAGQIIGFGLILLILALLTSKQGLVYRNQETLWRDTIAKNPDAWVAYQNLGEILRTAGQTDEARNLYLEGHRRHPDANFLASLALLEFGLYEKTASIDNLKECIRLSEETLQMRPRFPPARALLAQAYGAQGPAMQEKVIQQLEQMSANMLAERMHAGLVIQKFQDPTFADAIRQLFTAYNSRGRSQLAAGNQGQAFDMFRKSNRALQGPGSPKWRDLYPWAAGTPWFPLELQRIWMLATTSDPSIRDVQRAKAQLSTLLSGIEAQMLRGRLTANQRLIYQAELLDLQAAVLAATEDYQAAVETVDRLLALVQASGAPEVWLQSIRARRTNYAAGRGYQLGKRMPFAPGR